MRAWHVQAGWLGSALAVGLTMAAPLQAQTFTSGSTGADGPFSPTSNVTLSLPADGVFNFTTITIPAGVTVTFARNVANTPVTLLATGNVVVAGTLDVSGGPGGPGVTGVSVAMSGGAGGPGGFDGGQGTNGLLSSVGGAGLGPGGAPGNAFPGGGGFGTGGNAGYYGAPAGSAYGTATLLPLLGGSGGGGGGNTTGGTTAAGGGGGGGALVIAASGTISVSGSLQARGGAGGAQGPVNHGGGGGSGGAVRLVATTLAGSGGTINVIGGTGGAFAGAGGVGRIRLEAFSNTAAITIPAGTPSIVGSPTSVVLPNGPTLRITSLAGVTAPTTPTGVFATPDVTLPATTGNPVTVAVAATNIPVGTAVTVTVTPQVGPGSTTSATLAGTNAASTASASVTIPTTQPCVISLTASFTLLALAAGGPVYVDGEVVDHVRIAAADGGPARITLVTVSGRARRLSAWP